MNHKMAFIILITGLIIAGCTTTNKETNTFEQPSFLGEDTTGRVISGTTQQGDVQIELTPLEMRDGAFIVEFSANTHTVDLSVYDLRNIAILSTNGKEYFPTTVPKLDGHHVSGEMAFLLSEEPTTYTITITGIPNVPERVFSWEEE